MQRKTFHKFVLAACATAKSGAPAGTFKSRFMPPGTGDQVTGASIDPLEGRAPVTIKAGDNELEVTVAKPKKK